MSWCLPRACVQDKSNAFQLPVACEAVGVLDVLHKTAIRDLLLFMLVGTSVLVLV